ncbi:cytochrome P450 [Thermomonospora umbrina]|uniref:cytochrome P450 n=1 Tax=Thermomonospora umbrina TaxID=111806 RepID=UPI001FEA643C|nr:cytochrome P450 [Thermomonospora umbrina]
MSFSLYDHAIHADPYPVYERMREEAPVYRNDAEDFWALTRHADVAEALRDHARFSSANGVLLEPALWGPEAHRFGSFLAMDPPRHTRLRGLVSRGFTPRRVAELEERIRVIARRHLEPALEGGSFDLVADYAARLPMDVISELAGVPEGDRAELRRLADLIVHREEGVRDLPAAGIEAMFTLAGYFADLIAERRDRRRDDLASALLGVADGDARLTEEEILGVLFLLVAAGNETTANLIGNAWHCAWRHLDRPAAAFARIEDWIEETLRLEPASQGIARTAVDGFTLHGVAVPPEARVLLLIGSANRDPRVFPDPDRLDLDRDTSAKVAFGVGRHYCLGAGLARLEARVALEELAAHVTGFEVDEAAARRVHSPNVRGFASLPTTVTLR